MSAVANALPYRRLAVVPTGQGSVKWAQPERISGYPSARSPTCFILFSRWSPLGQQRDPAGGEWSIHRPLGRLSSTYFGCSGLAARRSSGLSLSLGRSYSVEIRPASFNSCSVLESIVFGCGPGLILRILIPRLSPAALLMVVSGTSTATIAFADSLIL